MYFILILSIILILLLNFFLQKKNFLLNFSGEKHQIFLTEKKIPLSGGIVLFFTSFLYFELEILKVLIISSIFFIGLLSDLKFFKSPKLRIILQICFVLLIIKFVNVYLTNTRIDILDNFLKLNIFNIIFTCFCILIIINGSNFIDGVNTSVLGYYSVITFILIYLEINQILVISIVNTKLLLIILLILLFFNFFNKLFLGDNGSCQLGLIFSILLIKIYIDNQFISPFFIINLLWYPAFENLFSIIRKISFAKSPIKADINHLHHLMFLKFKNLNIFDKQLYNNNLTGVVLNTYNSIALILSSIYLTNTKFQITLIILNILIYLFVYYKLLNFKKMRK